MRLFTFTTENDAGQTETGTYEIPDTVPHGGEVAYLDNHGWDPVRVVVCTDCIAATGSPSGLCDTHYTPPTL